MMCMNGKVNQGPLFDINVSCSRSLKTKLHPMIVRQYSHLKSVIALDVSVDGGKMRNLDISVGFTFSSDKWFLNWLSLSEQFSK